MEKRWIPVQSHGWVYLAAIMDLHTREIVGWQMADRMGVELVQSALEMAIQNQKPKRGLIHHSDRGSQYASAKYQRFLWRNGMICSMSRKGNCWDNAPLESIFHTLKTVHVYWENFRTKEEAVSSIFEWIAIFYNRQRIHSSIDYKSPLEMKEEFMLKAV